MGIKLSGSDRISQEPQASWEEALGSAGPLEAGRLLSPGHWGPCLSSSLGASPVRHLLASPEPLENQATQGTWPFRPHSTQHLFFFLHISFIYCLFIGLIWVLVEAHWVCELPCSVWGLGASLVA